MVLTRGLSMEQQKSNRDSLQYSSGYSTETTTPSCSEDTIPSQGGTLICRPPLFDMKRWLNNSDGDIIAHCLVSSGGVGGKYPQNYKSTQANPNVSAS